GGYLYVYTGLLLAAQNDAEIAGVLGHEMGHVVQRHTARQLVTANGLGAIAGAALGKNPSMVKQIAAAVVEKGSMLKFSRDDEAEADDVGARYASQAGYDPHGLITFFQRLAAQEGKSPRILGLL